jgi:hypothetical protein
MIELMVTAAAYNDHTGGCRAAVVTVGQFKAGAQTPKVTGDVHTSCQRRCYSNPRAGGAPDILKVYKPTKNEPLHPKTLEAA